MREHLKRLSKSLTPLGGLRALVGAWARGERMAMAGVAVEVMARHAAMGGHATTRVDFDGRDAYARTTLAAEKIGRWLDDETKTSSLLPVNMLPVMLATLPRADARAWLDLYLLAPLGLTCANEQHPGAAVENWVGELRAVMCESAGAHDALAALADGATAAELDEARRQLTESIERQQQALCAVERARAAAPAAADLRRAA